MQFTYCLEYAPILAGKVPNCFCVELHLESRIKKFTKRESNVSEEVAIECR